MTKETIPQKEKIFKNKRGRLLVLRQPRAVEQIRTSMLFTALPPQSSASTNFATTALGATNLIKSFKKTICLIQF